MDRIPEWQYPLYKESDRIAYKILEGLGKSTKYPKLTGTKGDICSFLKLMVYSGKSRDYRKFRDIIITELEKGEINIPKILDRGRSLEIPRGVDESWVVFTQDKRICELLDDFHDTGIEFHGSENEIIEFVIRYMLSQLLQDWRGPKMAVALECLEKQNVKVSELNKLLKTWDYTKIF